jgi:hypothetical protein
MGRHRVWEGTEYGTDQHLRAGRDQLPPEHGASEVLVRQASERCCCVQAGAMCQTAQGQYGVGGRVRQREDGHDSPKTATEHCDSYLRLEG